MKKVLAVAAASLMIAGFTIDSASAKHHRSHHKMSTMTTGSSMKGNAELKGNNGNSAGGNNSLANTNNPDAGRSNNAGPPMK